MIDQRSQNKNVSGFEVSNNTFQDPYGTSGYFVSCFLVKLSFIYLFQNALVFTLKLSKITLNYCHLYFHYGLIQVVELQIIKNLSLIFCIYGFLKCTLSFPKHAFLKTKSLLEKDPKLPKVALDNCQIVGPSWYCCSDRKQRL